MDRNSSRSMKPFSATSHNGDGFFEGQSIPSPSQPMWVPFAGKKRKADESDNYFDKEFGPPPGKQCAVDESVAELILNNHGVLIGTANCDNGPEGLDLTQSSWEPGLQEHGDGGDEEMEDEMDDPPYSFSPNASTFPNELAGGHHLHHENFEGVKNAGGVSDDGSCEIDPVDLHETTGPTSSSDCMKNKDKISKIYFFEGLKEALEKQNEESSLPRSLIQQVQKETTMALVLWKPGILTPPTEPSHPVPLSSLTSARAIPRKPPYNDDKKRRTAEEEDKNSESEDMEVCI